MPATPGGLLENLHGEVLRNRPDITATGVTVRAGPWVGVACDKPDVSTPIGLAAKVLSARVLVIAIAIRHTACPGRGRGDVVTHRNARLLGCSADDVSLAQPYAHMATVMK